MASFYTFMAESFIAISDCIFNLFRFSNMVDQLVDVQWAVIMAEMIFKLLHPKDWLTLETVGITVDPENSKVPLFYRLWHFVRR